MEETVIRMAAPTLAGIKTGSLFPYYYRSREELGKEMGRLNRLLIPRGLQGLPLPSAEALSKRSGIPARDRPLSQLSAGGRQGFSDRPGQLQGGLPLEGLRR